MFYQVALLGLKVPPLTYQASVDIKLGSLVSVKLKNKDRLGIILKKERQGRDKIKEIGEVIIPGLLSLGNLRFYNFVSRYYFVYPGEVISFALPGIKDNLSFLKHPNITSRQPGVARARGFPGVYLFVGKKEEDRIRFLLRKVREGGGNILVLVPEIVTGERIFLSLAPCLKDGLVFYHSSLKRKERIENWLKIMAGRARVIIGPKQTVFLPIPNLAGILVEEEESPFYKERERRFHYHARDCAVARGKIENVPVYLFSHTPSCESFYNCQIGKYKLFGRFKRKKIRVITANAAGQVLSNQLRRFLSNYRKGEKFYLLVQQKGFSRYIICADCGLIPRCLICGFPLFYHQANSSLSCHICKKEERVFEECPNCKGANFLFKGIGSEMVQREITRNFPHLKLVELEKRKGDFDEKGIFLGTSYALARFGENHFDCAAIISLEELLSFPDFRTEERAFQIFHSLITRLKEGGFLIVQTRNSQNRFLGRTFNPPLFYQRLLKERKDCFFPPFSHIVKLEVFQGEAAAQKKYEEIKKRLASLSGANVFPPFKRFAKKKGVFPYVILLKLKPEERLSKLLTRADLTVVGEEIEVDINPIEILS